MLSHYADNDMVQFGVLLLLRLIPPGGRCSLTYLPSLQLDGKDLLPFSADKAAAFSQAVSLALENQTISLNVSDVTTVNSQISTRQVSPSAARAAQMSAHCTVMYACSRQKSGLKLASTPRVQEAATDGHAHSSLGGVDEQWGQLHTISGVERCVQQWSPWFCRPPEGHLDRHLPQCNNIPGVYVKHSALSRCVMTLDHIKSSVHAVGGKSAPLQ